MFVDTGKIVGVLGKEPPIITNTVSVDIDLAREIYERLLSKGWRKTEEVWTKKDYLGWTLKISIAQNQNLFN